MNEELRKIGHPSQLATVRRIRLEEGRSEGVRLIEVRNAAGLYVSLAEDNGLNLYDCSYRGVNMAFKSKNGLVSNRYFNDGSANFSSYWPAGMLYTCGLANTGTCVTDKGTFYPVHGRYGMLPAEHVSVEQNEKEIIVKGEIRDGKLKDYQLVLHREVRIAMKKAEIELRDTLENAEGIPTEFMLLYHCNFGYPLLDEGCRILFTPSRLIKASGDAAASQTVTAPRDDKEEELFWRDTAGNDIYTAALINDERKLAASVSFDTKTLPYCLEWKNLNAHDYAVGLEPTATMSLGRAAERENGTLPVLGAYEKRNFRVKLSFFEGCAALRKLQQGLQ